MNATNLTAGKLLCRLFASLYKYPHDKSYISSKLSTFLLLSSKFDLASSSLSDKLEAEEKRGSLQQEAESLKVIDFS